MERARAVATEGRALPAGTWARVPVLGPLVARVLERLLRPYAARQREATADLVRALDALSARVGAVEAAGVAAGTQAPPAPSGVGVADLDAVRAEGAALSAKVDALRAELDTLRAELADLRALLEGHARRMAGDGAAVADTLRRITMRLDGIEPGAPGRGGDPSS